MLLSQAQRYGEYHNFCLTLALFELRCPMLYIVGALETCATHKLIVRTRLSTYHTVTVYTDIKLVSSRRSDRHTIAVTRAAHVAALFEFTA